MASFLFRRRHEPVSPEPLPAELPGGPPIFLSGCNRGGTSVLSLLLGHHPQVHNLGTGPFREGQWIWRQKFRDRSRHRWAIEPWRSRMRKTAADATPEIVAFFRAMFHAQAAAAPGRRLLEKTPANAIRIPLIDRLFPASYVVHVVRDGRHTVASLRARKVPLLDAARQWVAVHTIALPDLAALGAERALVVRYEELLAEPLATLLRVCVHCGLAHGPAEQAALAQAIERHFVPPLDRWRTLSEADRRRVLAVIAPLQAQLGYPVEL